MVQGFILHLQQAFRTAVIFPVLYPKAHAAQVHSADHAFQILLLVLGNRLSYIFGLQPPGLQPDIDEQVFHILKILVEAAGGDARLP